MCFHDWLTLQPRPNKYSLQSHKRLIIQERKNLTMLPQFLGHFIHTTEKNFQLSYFLQFSFELQNSNNDNDLHLLFCHNLLFFFTIVLDQKTYFLFVPIVHLFQNNAFQKPISRIPTKCRWVLLDWFVSLQCPNLKQLTA